MALVGEYRLWYLEDLLKLLQTASVADDVPLIVKARRLVTKLGSLYDIDDQRYFKAVGRGTTYDMTERLITAFEQEITSVAKLYAKDYAQRVFHDRQLCEHLSRTLISIGFDGADDWEEVPKQWIDRQPRWPTWAVRAVIARDRGACAKCGTNMTMELRAASQIDHIVALASGGTNDICNLQLLCDKCNLKKAAQDIPVESSVPEYLQLASKRRSKRTDTQR